MGKEIERKYLIIDIPSNLKVVKEKRIFQTYLAIGEEEVRIRKSTSELSEEFVMTIKKGNSVVREETEFAISKETYLQLLSDERKPLIKTRQVVEMENHLFEIDFYVNYLSELTTVEVEFQSEEEANAFIKPEWFGDEVTSDSRYKNQSLWKSIQE